MNFFKNTSLISVDSDSSAIEYARWHYLAKLFNLSTNTHDINLTRLHSNGSAQIKENTERFETVRNLIQTRFTNIKSKFYYIRSRRYKRIRYNFQYISISIQR